MTSKSIAYYEARIAFGITSLLPTLALPLAALYHALLWRNQPRNFFQVTQAFELILPLAAGMIAAHLMTIEHDEQFDELRSSYAEPRWRVPALRTGDAVILTCATLIIGLLSYRWAYGEFDAWNVIPSALSPAIYLMGLSLLASNLTRNTWITAAIVMGYWFFEFQTRGMHTQNMFLFTRSYQLTDVSYDLNKALLATGGILFLLANVFISEKRAMGFKLRRLGFGK